MSYKEVLRGLTAGEQRNASDFARYESIRLADDRERGRQRLEALSTFSETLDGFVKSKFEETKEQEILINYLENKMCILINKVYNLQNKRL